MSSIQLVSCPQCGAALFGDSPVCHRCHHVINPKAGEPMRERPLPTDEAVKEDLEVCPKCGETYRKGLVRCWSCGTFTRDEIGAAYEERVRGRMEADGGFQELPVLRVQSSEDDKTSATGPQADHMVASTSLGGGYDLDFEETSAADDDFELGSDVELSEATGGDEGYTLAAVEEQTLPLTSSIEAIEPPLPEVAEPPLPANAEPPLPGPGESPREADELLEIARQQQRDIAKARKELQKRLGGFVVYCPQGCRVRVQDRHRGRTGRCPKCHSIFFVPLAKKTAADIAAPATTEAAEDAPLTAGKFTRWQLDLRLHSVQPQKLKLKPDSLLNDFQAVDVGFADDQLLLVTLTSGGGMFGGGKKKDVVRAAVLDHLKTKPTLEGLPGAATVTLPREAVGQINLAQPAPPETDSMFGQIPVFGAGRIAVKLPKQGDSPTMQFLSFNLGEFRQFSTNLSELYGIADFGGRTEIPLADEFQTANCAVSNEPVQGLLGLPYYEKDPALKLEVSGWQCGVCKAVVSEAARDKAKLGGAKGKGIAKAKCPKCSQKMGSNPWYKIAVEPVPEVPVAAEATDETAPEQPA